MSAAREGRKIQDTVDRTTKQAMLGVQPGAPTTTAGNITGGNFPMRYSAGTEEWQKRAALKQAMVIPGREDAMTPFGQLQFSDADAEALLRQEEAVKDAMFDQWFAENWNKADLPTRRLAQELNPGFYARQEAAMVDRAKLALRIKLMQLRGPSNDPEDLRILFGLQTGEIQLDPDWDRIGAQTAAAGNRAAVARDIDNATQLFRPANYRQQNPGQTAFYSGAAAASDAAWGAADFPGLTRGVQPLGSLNQ